MNHSIKGRIEFYKKVEEEIGIINSYNISEEERKGLRAIVDGMAELYEKKEVCKLNQQIIENHFNTMKFRLERIKKRLVKFEHIAEKREHIKEIRGYGNVFYIIPKEVNGNY